MTFTDADIFSIQRALAAEVEVSAKPVVYTVKAVRRESSWLVLTLGRGSGYSASPPIDESLEGSQAWWPEPSRGNGEISIVQVEEDEVWLADQWGSAPAVGGKLMIYPPRFLDALREVWRDHSWTQRIKARLAECPAKSGAGGAATSIPSQFSWLRKGQQQAFRLLRDSVGFLWGPPGTGKTTTVGALVATYVTQNPHARVMIVSTTNSAVDQALESVDKSLENLGLSATDPKSVRARCKRIGQNFEVSRYAKRKHLLTQRNPAAVNALIENQKKRPLESDPAQLAQWRVVDEQLRQKLREYDLETLKSSSVTAMTATRAAFGLDMLRQIPVPDLLVMDEASQLSLAYALALMPLGKAVLFAGDPEQLSPIVRTDSYDAQRWLGESPFAWRSKLARDEATVFLDEQSRMAPKICAVVGAQFYNGNLKVCHRSIAQVGWAETRRKAQGSGSGFEIVPITMEGRWSGPWGGPVREESAERVVQLARDLLMRLEPEDIQIITPFRSQRKMIKQELKKAAARGVRVTTAHRAQGSERMAIIFDPVQGGEKFLEGANGRRLINVALSRAQGQVYLCISSGDMTNPTFAGLAKHGGYEAAEIKLPLMCELGGHPQFPQVLAGKTFGYLGSAVKFKAIAGTGDSVKVEHVRGRDLSGRFSLSGMRAKCCDRNKCPMHKGPNAPRCVA
jgi:DNA replication ATP-dependent helicase Dna2